MKFVGVREFKEGVVKYLNEGNEIVGRKRWGRIFILDFVRNTGKKAPVSPI